jgi:hypothetical protein
MAIEGYQVLELQPDFATPPQIRGMFPNDLLEFSAADRLMSYRGKHVFHNLYFDWLLHGETEIRTLEDFFFDHKGKWTPFFVPSWHQELVPADDLLSGANQLSIEPVDYDNVYFQESATPTRLGNYIFLYDQDGTLWTPKVSNVTGSDPEVLTLNANAAKDWLAGEFIIGFMYFVRFLDDALELSYEGTDQARAKIGMKETTLITAEADVAGDPEIEGIAFYDEFDSYSVGATTNLNRGWAWLAAWDAPARQTNEFDEVFFDDLSTYTATSAINGTTIDGDGGDGNFVAN